jgi:hypothetical protein
MERDAQMLDAQMAIAGLKKRSLSLSGSCRGDGQSGIGQEREVLAAVQILMAGATVRRAIVANGMEADVSLLGNHGGRQRCPRCSAAART